MAILGLDAVPVLQTGAAALLLGASYCDLAQRRVPNTLVYSGAAAGLVLAAVAAGLSGALYSLGGAAVALVLLPLWLGGGLGAGDVKLTAAAGAFLGPALIAIAALYALMLAAVMAVLVLVARRLQPAVAASGSAAPAPKGIAFAPCLAVGAAAAILAPELHALIQT